MGGFGVDRVVPPPGRHAGRESVSINKRGSEVGSKLVESKSAKEVGIGSTRRESTKGAAGGGAGVEGGGGGLARTLSNKVLTGGSAPLLLPHSEPSEGAGKGAAPNLGRKASTMHGVGVGVEMEDSKMLSNAPNSLDGTERSSAYEK